ncbi:DoxX family protein [Acinetobacter stercoris]|uniref:DoxX n=1 Tax=Acinetobacter stercoris TaxID=2126983 RepID=A0A2U3MZ09_9GAMM|nr:DoxX family protein [Acinetobacter stercoris]SPL70615.1 DoxX [Acinetobacter stercoris]
MYKFLFHLPLNFEKSTHLILIMIRLSLGLFFSSTGFNKLFIEANQKIMFETIVTAGIPFPEFMAIFISGLEFIAGFFLILGLFTKISSLILCMICLVALITVGIHSIPPSINMITWLSWFFYIHDFLYLLLLMVIITHKTDYFSIDHYIPGKYKKPND